VIYIRNTDQLNQKIKEKGEVSAFRYHCTATLRFENHARLIRFFFEILTSVQKTINISNGKRLQELICKLYDWAIKVKHYYEYTFSIVGLFEKHGTG
jgi:flagellin-specific chaperone FliS